MPFRRLFRVFPFELRSSGFLHKSLPIVCQRTQFGPSVLPFVPMGVTVGRPHFRYVSNAIVLKANEKGRDYNGIEGNDRPKRVVLTNETQNSTHIVSQILLYGPGIKWWIFHHMFLGFVFIFSATFSHFLEAIQSIDYKLFLKLDQNFSFD